MVMRWAIRLLRLPVDDYLVAVESCVSGFRIGHPVLGVVACALSWWIYVPIHELAHALGCVLGGGEVTRLEIDPIYGAAVLQHLFPFVAVGSDYAGQLTGFDTRGSDLTYVLTDIFPFLLTVFIGVPLLRSVATARHGRCRRVLTFGAALPVAYAPFISLTGDYYEMGSIIVTRLVVLWSPGFDLERWRSDDLFTLAAELCPSVAETAAPDVVGMGTAFFLGTALAFATYATGRLWASALYTRKACAT